jgi:hypothetical protein
MYGNESIKAGARKRGVPPAPAEDGVPPAPAEDGVAWVRVADGAGPGCRSLGMVTAVDIHGCLKVEAVPLPESRRDEDGCHAGLFFWCGERRVYWYESPKGGGYWFRVRDGAVRAIPASLVTETACLYLYGGGGATVPVPPKKRTRRKPVARESPDKRVYRNPERMVARGI